MKALTPSVIPLFLMSVAFGLPGLFYEQFVSVARRLTVGVVKGFSKMDGTFLILMIQFARRICCRVIRIPKKLCISDCWDKAIVPKHQTNHSKGIEMNSRTSSAKIGVAFVGCRQLVPDARMLGKIISMTILALSLVAIGFGEDDVVTAAHATIQKIDSTGKTIVVKTDDGVGHTLHVLDSTAVYGAGAGDAAAKDSWHGLKVGGEVVVRYTKTGTEETAVAIDKVGADGLKATEGTVKEIDKGGKNLVVVAGDGTEQTFKMTGQATKEVGSGIGKGSKVTVFYIGKAGKKVAHFLGTTSSGPS